MIEEFTVGAESVEPAVVHVAYLGSIDEVVEHARAADTLGLGFRVESYMVAAADSPQQTAAEFEFTLFGDIQTRLENED